MRPHKSMCRTLLGRIAPSVVKRSKLSIIVFVIARHFVLSNALHFIIKIVAPFSFGNARILFVSTWRKTNLCVFAERPLFVPNIAYKIVFYTTIIRSIIRSNPANCKIVISRKTRNLVVCVTSSSIARLITRTKIFNTGTCAKNFNNISARKSIAWDRKVRIIHVFVEKFHTARRVAKSLTSSTVNLASPFWNGLSYHQRTHWMGSSALNLSEIQAI